MSDDAEPRTWQELKARSTPEEWERFLKTNGPEGYLEFLAGRPWASTAQARFGQDAWRRCEREARAAVLREAQDVAYEAFRGYPVPCPLCGGSGVAGAPPDGHYDCPCVLRSLVVLLRSAHRATLEQLEEAAAGTACALADVADALGLKPAEYADLDHPDEVAQRLVEEALRLVREHGAAREAIRKAQRIESLWYPTDVSPEHEEEARALAAMRAAFRVALGDPA